MILETVTSVKATKRLLMPAQIVVNNLLGQSLYQKLVHTVKFEWLVTVWKSLYHVSLLSISTAVVFGIIEMCRQVDLIK
jgi:hypothetical protein